MQTPIAKFSGLWPRLLAFAMVHLILVWVLVGANLLSLLLTRRREALYDLLAGTQVTHLPAEAA